MSASGYEDRVELMVDIHKFFTRVGIVADYRELAWLGFELGTYLSLFRLRHLPHLLAFCVANSDYHVVMFDSAGTAGQQVRATLQVIQACQRR